ncbi:large-conductance mechanosensitive channel [Roseivivax marinus]|jgi:large conductance mechanosensitive channel|uniref:Large-conductance mechanosensitive channel n=1 Tax=Roseivivax marinus TaxID=1379903 RepID=W4HG39_9RHOB|nr:large conductance mechanosensitive channel protein MscL [Roseivivax marinus]ETW11669.1 large-conductance mechanosensitive channel [Roseivivax marinus]UMA65558.1 large conductance mechanosensitive channel protein MscL [Roseivivax marinus]SEL44704.1 large conductance mechanosensitive channel [Roseivivax marinus]
MIQEFRDFIAKGNVIDLAVGIIIGAAFTAIVNSLVSDLINPIIGLFTGGIDFSGWFYVLGDAPEGGYASVEAAQEAGAAVFAVGNFLMAVINFFIVALVVFALVKIVNRIKSAAEKPDDVAPEVHTGPSELDVLIEIRDQLKRD